LGDIDAEHDLYADDAICDDPQSGERIQGRRNLQAMKSADGYGAAAPFETTTKGLPGLVENLRDALKAFLDHADADAKRRSSVPWATR
jgi:hypothetical protein